MMRFPSFLSGPSARAAECLLLIAATVLLIARLPHGSREGALPSSASLAHRVDLDAAPWFELVNLPGIGAVRAREIVRDRELHGPFRSVGDLCRVPGIGPVTVERIREFVVRDQQ
jgi:competence ComEA-like helix-hairpin-helix protein